MSRVTSSEFQKNFGKYKELAQREPVSVTSNGRDSVVLLSVAEYRAFLEYKNSRYADQGKTSDSFKSDVDSFMDDHADVLDGLTK